MILALECGAMSKNDVVEWADNLILEIEEPDERLFDVSIANNTHDIISILKGFDTHNESKEVAKLAFGLFHAALNDGRTSYDRVAKKLYDMAFSGFVPDEKIESKMMCYWDELYDANTGIYGDPEEIKKELLGLLGYYGS